MQFLFPQPVETFNHSPHQQQPSITQSHFISLPRVVAIIAEALAVEVLPPDHPAKARLIGIVKQVQVKIKTLFFLFKIKTQSTCYREMLECSRLAWMLSQNLRSWRFEQCLPELLILDLPPSSRDNTSSLNGKNTYYAAYMLEINISSLIFIKMVFTSNICDWTNIMHVVVMESIWKLNTNEIRWLYCCGKQSRDK